VTEKKASGLLGPASLDALLAGLIDYAGLFPPATLDMKTAVANYARYLGGPYARALGRFVLPVSRFAEFEAAFERVQAVEPWGLSALLGASPDSDLMAIEHFNRRHAQRACVDVIEVKANTSHEISQIRGCIRGTITPYFEIRPFDCAELLQTIHHVRGRAKIRTGGVTPDAFPSSEAVAGFIGDCAKHGIALKATAGLHHPVRGVKSLTYEPQAPTGNMHGFLNVFLATVFAHRGAAVEQLEELLDEDDPLRFRFDAGAAHWREYEFPTDSIRHTRAHLAVSFGSCSFEEPIADLKTLNLL